MSLEKLTPPSKGITSHCRSENATPRRAPEPVPRSGHSHPEGGSHHAMVTRSSGQSGQPETSVDPPGHRLKVGDSVVAYNKKNIAIHGVVRWVGRKTAARNFQFDVVGIETVSHTLSLKFANFLLVI